MGKTFVLSDESVNSYGFRVMTEGISLDTFRKNPVMLWNHTRSWSDKGDLVLPIGRWTNIRVSEGKLLADAEFDMEDPFAVKIAKKVDKGILNMCSIGLKIIEESEAPEFILPGQTRRTVVRSQLREASIVDIGSNSNSVALYDSEGNVIELNADGASAVGLIYKQKNEEMKVEEIVTQLGLPKEATDAEVSARIAELKSNSKDEEKQQLRTRIQELEKEKEQVEKNRITELVDQAVADKRITADKKQHFVELGQKVGFEDLKTTLACMNVALTPKDFIGKAAAPSKSYSEMSEKELRELRDNDSEAYASLYEKEFGFRPDMN